MTTNRDIIGPLADVIGSLYDGHDQRDALIFNSLDAAFRPPDEFRHGEWALVATLPAEGDGHEARVYECRMPARFFKVEANGYIISSGSGDEIGLLCVQIAKAIATGMLGVHSTPDLGNRLALVDSIYTDLQNMGFGTDDAIDGGDCCEYLGQLLIDLAEAFVRDGVRAPE